MYLARIKAGQKNTRYVIRHSYAHEDGYRTRDLIDLGEDPARFIVYPGGNAFYIDTKLEDRIAEQGVAVSQDDLEAIFLPFLSARVRRVIDGFDRRQRHHRPASTCRPSEAYHPFDRYRLHFLKFGEVNQRELGCTPDSFYARLEGKSRDEIEYDFMAAETILDAGELAQYAYQIFDLQRFFDPIYARTHPEALDRQQMDDRFEQVLCDLNRDAAFWMGAPVPAKLHPHLVRYALIYFDSAFPLRDPFHDFLRGFRNRHRVHRPPESVRIKLEEAARLLGVTVDALKRMDCRSLTRQYRQRAQRHHPDKGGDAETFLKLTAAYEKLLKRKSSA